MKGGMPANINELGLLTTLRWNVREVRKYFQNRPLLRFQERQVTRGAFSSHAVAEALKSNGICILENYLSKEQAALNGLKLSPTYPDDPDIEPNSFVTRINFSTHQIFADLILAAAEAYYRRPISLTGSLACRLDPIEPYEGTAFRWHHDCKGEYVKAMWLLTDVPPSGQRMPYLAGSRTLKHRFATYADTRFTDEQVNGYGERVECAAPAWSVIGFDANGLHRGNRNLGPRRDTIFGNYTAGCHRIGCQFDLAVLSHLSEWQKSILLRSPTPSKEFC